METGLKIYKRNTAIWADNTNLAFMGNSFDETTKNSMVLLNQSATKTHVAVLQDTLADARFKRTKEIARKLFAHNLASMILEYEMAAFLLIKEGKLEMLVLEGQMLRERLEIIQAVLIPNQNETNALLVEKEQLRKSISDLKVSSVYRLINYLEHKTQIMQSYHDRKISRMTTYNNTKVNKLATYFSGKANKMSNYYTGQSGRMRTYFNGKSSKMSNYYTGQSGRMSSYFSGKSSRMSSYYAGKGSSMSAYFDSNCLLYTSPSPRD